MTKSDAPASSAAAIGGSPVKFSPIWIGVLTAVAASERNTSPLLFVNLLSPRHSSRSSIDNGASNGLRQRNAAAGLAFETLRRANRTTSRYDALLRHRAALAQVNSFGSSGRSEAIMLVAGATVMAARQSPRRLRLPQARAFQKSAQRTMKAMSLSADQSRGPREAIAFNCSSPFAVALDSSLPLIG